MTTFKRHDPISNSQQNGLILLRKDADILGLDISECLALEKTNPSRAYINIKMIVGKRISTSSSICELRALSELWDKICAAQSKEVQGNKILGSQKQSVFGQFPRRLREFTNA